MKKLLLFLVLSYCVVKAQWVQTSGPTGPYSRILAAEGATVFAGTTTGIYRSYDNGSSWTTANGSMSVTEVAAIAIHNGTVFANRLNGGIMRSTDYGNTWTITSGLPTYMNVRAFAANGSTIIAATSHGIYRSTNDGLNWVQIVNGINPISTLSALWLPNKVFVGSNSGLYVSIDDGLNWTLSTLNVHPVTSLAVNSSTLYAGLMYSPLRYSVDGGATWNVANSMLSTIISLAVCNGTVFAGAYDGSISYSSNSINWLSGNNGLTADSVSSLAIAGQHLMASFNTEGTWKRDLSQMSVGLKDYSDEKRNVHVYPNPAKNEIKLSLSKPLTHVELSAYSCGGIQYDLAGINENCYLTHKLPPGVYCLRIKSDQGDFWTKLIIIA